jgi:predicted ester cyclase
VYLKDQQRQDDREGGVAEPFQAAGASQRSCSSPRGHERSFSRRGFDASQTPARRSFGIRGEQHGDWKLPPSSHATALAAVCVVRAREWAPQAVATRKEHLMSTEDNKAVVGRWFTEFWGKNFNPAVIDELAAPDIRFEYSLHAPLRGRDAVRAFAERFRAAFPDLNFWGTADLIAEGDYVVGQWEGGGTNTGDAFDDMPYGPLPTDTGKVMRFTGTTVLKVEGGLITQEIGLDDGVTALRQLGLITKA